MELVNGLQKAKKLVKRLIDNGLLPAQPTRSDANWISYEEGL